LIPTENVTFFHSKLLLYNCKFHIIKDEQLDTITSLILLMLTMLPSLRLISSKRVRGGGGALFTTHGIRAANSRHRLYTGLINRGM